MAIRNDRLMIGEGDGSNSAEARGYHDFYFYDAKTGLHPAIDWRPLILQSLRGMAAESGIGISERVEYGEGADPLTDGTYARYRFARAEITK
jgi:hypothetical protein